MPVKFRTTNESCDRIARDALAVARDYRGLIHSRAAMIEAGYVPDIEEFEIEMATSEIAGMADMIIMLRKEEEIPPKTVYRIGYGNILPDGRIAWLIYGDRDELVAEAVGRPMAELIVNALNR